MKQLLLYIKLLRLDKPIGIYLLFFPCLFGILLAHHLAESVNIPRYLILFFTGCILLRTSGCIINDIFDKNLDRCVTRTKSRPIASEKISIFSAIIILIILLSLGLILLINFNKLSIIISLTIFPLVIIYPLTKRITYWPQLFLGIIYNTGSIISFTSILNTVNLYIILIYLSCICWTIIYDTLYAYQDIEDDSKICIKSTAILFNYNKKNLYLLILIQFLLLIILGFSLNFSLIYYIIIFFALLLSYKNVFYCNLHNKIECNKSFNKNIVIGIIISVALILSKTTYFELINYFRIFSLAL